MVHLHAHQRIASAADDLDDLAGSDKPVDLSCLQGLPHLAVEDIEDVLGADASAGRDSVRNFAALEEDPVHCSLLSSRVIIASTAFFASYPS